MGDDQAKEIEFLRSENQKLRAVAEPAYKLYMRVNPGLNIMDTLQALKGFCDTLDKLQRGE